MTRKGAFEDTAYGIIDAAKLYYTEASLESSNINETFTFPNDTKLKISGTKPAGGSVILDEKGKIELAIHNGKWCALKGKEEEKITITNYSEGKCGIVVEEEPKNVPDSCFTLNAHNPAEITGYTCENQSIVIPSEINGVGIKSIGMVAFQKKGLKKIIIPEGITEIGWNSFSENQLTSVTIPNSVIIIDDYAFSHNKLTGIVIPSGVTEISSFAFAWNQLTNATIPEGVVKIGEAAFYENDLTEITIPSSVTTIEQGVFSMNSNAKVIVKKREGSISGSPWGAASVQWIG